MKIAGLIFLIVVLIAIKIKFLTKEDIPLSSKEINKKVKEYMLSRDTLDGWKYKKYNLSRAEYKAIVYELITYIDSTLSERGLKVCMPERSKIIYLEQQLFCTSKNTDSIIRKILYKLNRL